MASKRVSFVLLTVSDYEKQFSDNITSMARDYYASGAEEEKTLKRNKSAFDRLLIRPRALQDVANVDTSVEWFGQKQNFPIGIAPTAFQRMAHRDGELATVRGAGATGTTMILSSWSTTSIKDVAAEAAVCGTKLWFQLYVYKNRAITESLVRRAEACGCGAIVLTVDANVLGRRLRDVRNGFSLPAGLKFANFETPEGSDMPQGLAGTSGFMQYVSEQIDPSLNWSNLRWLTQFTKLPVVVKGVMRADDVEFALKCGAKGILVSNHGGRQLDSAPATIEALPEVVRAAKGRCPVFVDGGIRNGRDVFKAIALGASGVFVGRPILYGLANSGAEGVINVTSILQKEFSHTMQLAGFGSISDIRNSPETVVHESFFSKL